MGLYNKLDWSAEADALLREMADGETTVPEIGDRIRALTGDNRSNSSVHHRMVRLGLPMRKQGRRVLISDDMKDFVYARYFEGYTIKTIHEMFNEYFGTEWSYTRIWRVALEANADRHISKEQFVADWTRLQGKFSPNGEICRKHWLWRWRRFDETRPASGCVFRGEREEIPQLMSKQQFAKQWTDMQRLFGITSTLS